MYIASMRDKTRKKIEAATTEDINGKRTASPLKTRVQQSFPAGYNALPDAMRDS